MMSLTMWANADLTRFLGDFTARAVNLRIEWAEHGADVLRFDVAMDSAESLRFYDRPALPHIVVMWQGWPIWVGRLEEVGVNQSGITCVAYGYWRALSDALYTALWSEIGTGVWRVFTDDDYSSAVPESYELDNNNRLYMALRNGETYGYNNQIGGWTFAIPHGSSRDIVEIEFDYEVLLPADWVIRLTASNDDFSGWFTDWLLAGDGSLQTGSVTETLTSTAKRVSFFLINDTGSAYSMTGDTGDYYAKITAIRVKTTTSSSVLVSDVAADIVSQVNALNGEQLSASTMRIAATTEDIEQLTIVDTAAAEALVALIEQYAGEETAALVDEAQRLVLRTVGSEAAGWLVDVRVLSLDRLLASLRNSVYAVYQDANGRTLRTAVSVDDASVARYGVTRQLAATARTSSSSAATAVRDAALGSHADIVPQAAVLFDVVMNGSGAVTPGWLMRPEDTLTLRNLPPQGSSEVIDQVRTSRIRRVVFDGDRGDVAVELSVMETVEALIAKALLPAVADVTTPIKRDVKIGLAY